MENNKFLTEISNIETPSFVIDIETLKNNLNILEKVKKRTSCKILLAIKAFAMFKVFPLIRDKLGNRGDVYDFMLFSNRLRFSYNRLKP
jgi:carboxynorspermidine decarboxylase